MPIIATTTGGADFEPIPAGNHIARCYSMIHIGTILENVMGTDKLLNKVRIGFELPLETKVFKEENGEQPYSIGKDFTLSMHEKSTLRKILESWRGKRFSEDEAKSFDITALLGVPCMVNVIHKQSKTSDRVYAEISSITPVPKGMNVPPQVNNTFEFTYTPFDEGKFNSLPDWIKNKCMASLEYTQMKSPSHQNAVPDSHTDVDDDLPF